MKNINNVNNNKTINDGNNKAVNDFETLSKKYGEVGAIAIIEQQEMINDFDINNVYKYLGHYKRCYYGADKTKWSKCAKHFLTLSTLEKNVVIFKINKRYFNKDKESNNNKVTNKF